MVAVDLGADGGGGDHWVGGISFRSDLEIYSFENHAQLHFVLLGITHCVDVDFRYIESLVESLLDEKLGCIFADHIETDGWQGEHLGR